MRTTGACTEFRTPVEDVSCMLPDDDGNLWLSATRGISRFDIAAGRFAARVLLKSISPLAAAKPRGQSGPALLVGLSKPSERTAPSASRRADHRALAVVVDHTRIEAKPVRLESASACCIEIGISCVPPQHSLETPLSALLRIGAFARTSTPFNATPFNASEYSRAARARDPEARAA